MTDKVLRNHPNSNFKANLPSLYMTATQYKFRFPQDRNFDYYIAFASENLEQLSFWQAKRLRFFQFQFNFLKPTQHDLNNNPNDITTTPSVKKTPPSNISSLPRTKTPSEFCFPKSQIHITFLLSLSLLSKSSLQFGTITIYDPVK